MPPDIWLHSYEMMVWIQNTMMNMFCWEPVPSTDDAWRLFETWAPIQYKDEHVLCWEPVPSTDDAWRLFETWAPIQYKDDILPV